MTDTDIKNIAKIYDLADRQVLIYKGCRDEDEGEDDKCPWLIVIRYHLLDGTLAEVKHGFQSEERRDVGFDLVTEQVAIDAVKVSKWMEEALDEVDEDFLYEDDES
ncbi:MAG: hypothetical protein V3T23_04655 [Nitrososphaerales archaeon]